MAINNRGETVITAKPSSKKEEIKKTIWETQSEAFKELQKAYKLDREAEKIAKETGTPIEPFSGIRGWFEKFWVIAIVWFVAAVVIWKTITPPPKRGHHGINKYGEPY